MKIKNILAATAITAWSGMACAGVITTFYGHTPNGDAIWPLTTYPQAATARNLFLGGRTADFYNFENVDTSKDPVTSLDINFGSGAGAVKATLSGGGQVATAPLEGTNDGRYSVSGVSCPPLNPTCSDQGTKYWEVIAPVGGTSSFKLEFNKAVDSFGFFGVDIGDFGGTVELVLTLAGGGTRTVQPGSGVVTGPNADASVLFFGVRATLAEDYFTAVQFRATTGSLGQTQDEFAFDMFMVTAAPATGSVPLPGSLALVGAALGGLALVRRRR